MKETRRFSKDFSKSSHELDGDYLFCRTSHANGFIQGYYMAKFCEIILNVARVLDAFKSN